jgi:hypothetical protein
MTAWKDGFRAGKVGDPYSSNNWDLRRLHADHRGVVVPKTKLWDEDWNWNRPTKFTYRPIWLFGKGRRPDEDWTIGWLEGSGRMGEVKVFSGAKNKP